MKALVVDDEPLVRSDLVFALARLASDCDVREAESALEALALLQESAYDVVFLDIHMPELSGLDAACVIARLPKPPQVVFVTAHVDHALAAFELAASDYLLKPVTEERLAATLRRVRGRAQNPAPKGAASGRLPVETEGRTLLARIDDVRFVEARGHVVRVALFDTAHRFRGSLADCARRLEAHGFLRVHRAYLVNPQRVVEVNPFMAGTYALRVDDRSRSEVPVSRNFVPALRAAFDL